MCRRILLQNPLFQSFPFSNAPEEKLLEDDTAAIEKISEAFPGAYFYQDNNGEVKRIHPEESLSTATRKVFDIKGRLLSYENSHVSEYKP